MRASDGATEAGGFIRILGGGGASSQPSNENNTIQNRINPSLRCSLTLTDRSSCDIERVTVPRSLGQFYHGLR